MTPRALLKAVQLSLRGLGLVARQELATDLLDLSKLDTGSLQIQPERVDMGELAHGIADDALGCIALALNPKGGFANYWLGLTMLAQGRADDAWGLPGPGWAARRGATLPGSAARPRGCRG